MLERKRVLLIISLFFTTFAAAEKSAVASKEAAKEKISAKEMETLTKAVVGESCKTSADCDRMLICADDFDPRFTNAKNKTCSVGMGAEQVDLARKITADFTERFLRDIHANITHNVHAIGSPLMTGMEADSYIPKTKQGVKDGLDAQIMNQFSEVCLSEFHIIAKETVRSGLNQFLKETMKSKDKANVSSKSSVQTHKRKIIEDIQKIGLRRMEERVNESWKLYVQMQKDAYKQLETEAMESSAQIHKRNGIQKRNFWEVFSRVVGGMPMVRGVGELIMKVADGILTFVKDAIKMVMHVIEGIEGFIKAVQKGDIKAAFKELEKGFVSAYHVAHNAAMRIAKGIWKGIQMIGEMAVKLWKFITSIKLYKVLSLIVSTVICTLAVAALTFIFPPLGGAALYAVTTLVVGAVYSTTIGPLIDQALLSLTDPGAIEFGGAVLRPNPNRNNRYCFSMEDMPDAETCLNDLKEICRFEVDDRELCTDANGDLYEMVEGKKHIVNRDTGDFLDPPKKYNGFTWDEKRREYCHTDEKYGYMCLNEALGLICRIDDQSKDLWCSDNATGKWVYFDENGVQKSTEFYDEERQETCEKIVGEIQCINEKLNATCLIGGYDWCTDGKESFAWWKNQKHYYNEATEEFEPPLEGYTPPESSVDDQESWEFDEERGEKCTYNESMEKICLNTKLDANCQIREDGEIDMCWNSNGFLDHSAIGSS